MEFYTNDMRKFFGRILRKARQRGVHIPDGDEIQYLLDQFGQAEHFFLPHDFPKHHNLSSELLQGVRLPFDCTVLEYSATVDPQKLRPGQAGASKRAVLLAEGGVGPDPRGITGPPDGFIVQPAYWLEEPVHSWELYPVAAYVPYNAQVRHLTERSGWEVEGMRLIPTLTDLASMQMEQWQKEGFTEEDVWSTMMADLSDEVRAALAFLAMIGCKNVHAVDREPTKTERKRARKQGKLPPFTYKILNVFLDEEHAQGESQGGTHRSPRLHTVRGHFKTIRGNKYWWRPFMRGKVEHGVVQKDYRVKERKA